MVGVPPAVLDGETAPHCDTGQETVQFTPLLLASLLTFATRRADEPVGTVTVLSETDTVIGAGGGGGGPDVIEEPLPPSQPT